eukprot:COSAG01_NODE_10514_length_2147_cov_1.992676_1_plen_37_part_00
MDGTKWMVYAENFETHKGWQMGSATSHNPNNAGHIT